MTMDRNEMTRHAQLAANALMADVSGARAVLVATPDGFDLAHAGALPQDASRLAAMVSSMAALGDAASREAAIGQPHCMVVDSSAGRLVMRSVQWRGEPMVVVLLADTSALLGMVLNALNGVERGMGTA
jgi:predicted regulator of Ras-like GTPase activity (Roadblock/LC7/MglB family)